jgi:hypothetical protein
MGCSDIWDNNPLDYVRFNPYFSDAGGRNFNPGPVDVPCREDTTANRAETYDGERLYHSAGRVPRLRVTWDIEKGGPISWYEGNGAMTIALRSCSGRGTNEC